MKKLTVGVAGSTKHTVMCASALADHPQFELIWVLTPPPQPIGRKQIMTENPLHQWANTQHLPVCFVDKKIHPQLVEQLPAKPDFLLVVDFGYLVPPWLLEFPQIAPVNVHPSLLPRWRGSSPGQFVLLYGESESAVTIMVMGEGLDTGPVLRQDHFTVKQDWTQLEYYHYSFEQAAQHLPETLVSLASGDLHPQPQPDDSPTPIARRLTKEDGFLPWEVVLAAQQSTNTTITEVSTSSSSLLAQVQEATQFPWAKVIAQAIMALSPWPGVWTSLPTTKGVKRMKILAVSLKGEQLVLEQVQLEGQQPARWRELQTLINTKQ